MTNQNLHTTTSEQPNSTIVDGEFPTRRAFILGLTALGITACSPNHIAKMPKFIELFNGDVVIRPTWENEWTPSLVSVSVEFKNIGDYYVQQMRDARKSKVEILTDWNFVISTPNKTVDLVGLHKLTNGTSYLNVVRRVGDGQTKADGAKL